MDYTYIYIYMYTLVILVSYVFVTVKLDSVAEVFFGGSHGRPDERQLMRKLQENHLQTVTNHLCLLVYKPNNYR